MKEVKIYTIVSDQLSPPITGESFCTDMVLHSDYAELEAKYAALAADNDKAMESLKQANAVVKLAHEKFSALAAENEALKYQKPTLSAMMSCLDAFYTDEDVPEQAMMAAYNILRKSVGTKDTDAFLAEVRAQGVEMFSEKFGGGTLLSNMVKEVAADFAAKLRKGAAQ
ncbi:Eae-like protein [Salmonella enterica]|nr:Eae-like protein [Salmonella enterica subsp. houtenae]EEU7649106.1 Eae-like protein [Salmonella enterica]